MLLNRVRIRTRLGLGFAAVLSGVLVVAAVAALSLLGLGGQIAQVGQQIYQRADALGAMERSIKDRDIALRDLASQDDPTVVLAEVKRFKAARDQFKALQERYRGAIDGDAELLALATTLDTQNQAAQRVVEAVLNHAMTGNTAEALKAAREQMTPVQTSMNTTLDATRQLLAKRSDSVVQAAQAGVRTSMWKMAAAATAVLLLGGTLAWLIAGSVVRPLRNAVAVVNEIASGDLTRPLQCDGSDETAEMLRALDGMQQALRVLVSEVRDGVESVATSSDEIAQGNLDLSNRTEQQAGSLQQTAANMAEMTGSVAQSADNARTARELATRASAVAAEGGSVVQRVVDTMGEIQASSRKIGDIIGTIDGIAFQTNILALNAAVEAARAGEQGRGFAVVASEVRSLAQRSAEAAREVKRLISASGERVEAGSALVNEAGATMARIVDQVQQVNALIGDISHSTEAQSSGISQVAGAVSQLDQMTQQNAALVEQSAAAAQSMAQQSERLAQTVSAFKL